MKVRERIREFKRIRASELLPNPLNWRAHPEHQVNAMMGALSEIGNTAALLAFETPEGIMLFDGHLRASILGDQEVWVGITDLSPEEGQKALFEHDQIGMMATVNAPNYETLLRNVGFQSEHLRQMAQDHATSYGIFIKGVTGAGDVEDDEDGEDGEDGAGDEDGEGGDDLPPAGDGDDAGDDGIEFRFGDYRGHLPMSFYKAFTARVKEARTNREDASLEDILKGWIGFDS